MMHLLRCLFFLEAHFQMQQHIFLVFTLWPTICRVIGFSLSVLGGYQQIHYKLQSPFT